MSRHALHAAGWSMRQLLTGLLAIPLSAIPLIGYLNYTPEGRLVRDKAVVAVMPPSLPTLSPRQLAAAAAAAPRYSGAVLALAYHGIGSADGEGRFVISPKRFAEHLAVLKAAGMRTVTASEVAASFAGGPALPPKAVMITFDDGRTDAMLYADPLLAEAGMKATMFVIAGAASDHGVYYAAWDKLESYAKSGRWDLEAHTDELHRMQQTALGPLPALTSRAGDETLAEYRQRVRKDLAASSEAIERHTGRRPVAFAYPFGAYGADRSNDPGIRQVLHEEVQRRFALAFHQDDQDTIPLLDGSGDRLGLRRLEVRDWSGMSLLRRISDAADRSRPTEPAPTEPPPLLTPFDPGYTAPTPTLPGLPPAAPPTTGPAEPTGGRRPAPARPTSPTTGTPALGSPAPVSTPGTTAPGATTTPTTGGPTSTTSPPGTAPTTTTTTTAPRPTTTTTTTRPKPPTTTTTTTIPPTTTTTGNNGCRSHGQGGVCKG
ncbi:MAG TPA: polysaccharide deacetylase family protein [Acidimicrobiales bacterium]|nr:polysaccharide deacetylase family protein [Acidimicrobiales bacterium]